MTKLINLFVFLAIMAPPMWAATETNTFAEAKSLANKLNKPILMDFWSDN